MSRLNGCKAGNVVTMRQPSASCANWLPNITFHSLYSISRNHLKDFAPLRDFRRLRDAEDEPISANLAYHIRSAYNRHELALELFQELGSEPQQFLLKASLQ